MSRRLNTVVNIGTIGAACLIVAVAVFRNSTMVRRGTSAPGTRVRGIEKQLLTRSDRTLLLVVKESCPYCAASMPLYRDLVRRRAQVSASSLRVVAVLLGQRDPAAAARYLERQRLSVDEIVVLSAKPQKDFGVDKTPTVILVDRTGTIREKWVGRLSASAEESLVRSILPTAQTLNRR